jgi:hypothetical protein
MHLPTVNLTRKYVANTIDCILCVKPPVAPNVIESLLQVFILILKAGLRNPIVCNSPLENPDGSVVLYCLPVRQASSKRVTVNVLEELQRLLKEVLAYSLPIKRDIAPYKGIKFLL